MMDLFSIRKLWLLIVVSDTHSSFQCLGYSNLSSKLLFYRQHPPSNTLSPAFVFPPSISSTSSTSSRSFILHALSSDELLDREGALQKGAEMIQKLYWAQFADDTYSGSLRLLNSESSSKAIKNSPQSASNNDDNNNTNSNTEPTINRSTKPRAPTKALLPATAIRSTLHSISLLLTEPNLTEDTLTQITHLLNTTPELSTTQQIRKAFNTYTASLQFSPTAFSVNLPEKSMERKRYIQDNTSLLTSRNTIVSDLDLRDLHRNQILTLVEDFRAELVYQQSSSSSSSSSSTGDALDWKELVELSEKLEGECNIWFGFIDDVDVNEALEVYRKQSK